MKLEDAIKELKLHGLAEQEMGPQGKKWVLTKKAMLMIKECWIFMREKFPNASEEDVTSRALIFLVMERLGLVKRKNLADYVTAIKTLAQNTQTP
jgi:hypothetical protein